MMNLAKENLLSPNISHRGEVLTTDLDEIWDRAKADAKAYEWDTINHVMLVNLETRNATLIQWTQDSQAVIPMVGVVAATEFEKVDAVLLYLEGWGRAIEADSMDEAYDKLRDGLASGGYVKDVDTSKKRQELKYLFMATPDQLRMAMMIRDQDDDWVTPPLEDIPTAVDMSPAISALRKAVWP